MTWSGGIRGSGAGSGMGGSLGRQTSDVGLSGPFGTGVGREWPGLGRRRRGSETGLRRRAVRVEMDGGGSGSGKGWRTYPGRVGRDG